MWRTPTASGCSSIGESCDGRPPIARMWQGQRPSTALRRRPTGSRCAAGQSEPATGSGSFHSHASERVKAACPVYRSGSCLPLGNWPIWCHQLRPLAHGRIPCLRLFGQECPECPARSGCSPPSVRPERAWVGTRPIDVVSQHRRHYCDCPDASRASIAMQA